MASNIEKELINEIPGLDYESIKVDVPDYKLDKQCDPVVITGMEKESENVCPAVLTDEEKEKRREEALKKLQDVVAPLLVSQESIYKDECVQKYIDDIQNVINGSITPYIEELSKNIENIPVYVKNFWSLLFSFSFSYKLLGFHKDNIETEDLFTNAKADSKIADKYIGFVKNIITQLNSADVNTGDFNDINKIDEKIKNISDELSKTLDNRCNIQTNGVSISINFNDDELKSGIIYDASNLHQEPNQQQLESGDTSVVILLDNLQNAINSYFSSISSISSLSYAVFIKNTTDISSIKNSLSNIIQDLKSTYELLINGYDESKQASIQASIQNQLKNINICGKPSPITLEADAEYQDNSTKNLNYNTFSPAGQPDFTKLKYWKVYAKVITQINLLPKYWRVGLLIPYPGGIKKIKTPIIWKPLSVISLPTMLIVIFLTIDGMIVCPTIWVLLQKPIADAESKHLVLLKGANQSIKTKTGVKVANLKIVDGIDTAPLFSKVQPFEKDDLPSIERLSVFNKQLINYITKFLDKAVQYMGV